ncbi:MAG: InlB B-repeat-containing protein, partial [Clostridia bacterium]|nr:InlB B-repeat-containing protein [Clostridia bacterium]
MKKKFSLIALALLMVMVLATYLVACNPDTPDNGGDTPDAPCVHAYDNACDTTCNLCSDVRTIEHSFASTFTQDTATHYYLCSVCGEKKDESEHVFDNPCDTACDICGLVRESEHKYSYSCDPDCDVCGDVREIEHLFKTDCDKACLNGCGFTRETEHVFADVLTQDTATHYYLCSVCGAKKDEESHSFTNTCDTDCNDCGATREITHKFSNTCDTDCNVCGTTREITHTYDNACDTKCDVCNEARIVDPHADGNNDCRCDACSILLGHTDSNADCVCDTCSTTLHADSNEDSVCDGCSVTLYKVTLDFQDEDVTNEIFYVVKDAKISSLLPTLVGNQYKNFSGWYKNANGTGKWLSSSKVTADITLYPGWNYNKQEVVFDLNYAGASKPTSEYRPLSLPLDLSSVPTREYWVFAGWYLDAALTTPYDVDELFLATSRLTLFASWEIEPAHTHTYEKSVVDVTCITDGYDLYTCVCGTTREITHTYDNACDTNCDICNESRTVAPHLDTDNNCRCDACSLLMNHA